MVFVLGGFSVCVESRCCPQVLCSGSFPPESASSWPLCIALPSGRFVRGFFYSRDAPWCDFLHVSLALGFVELLASLNLKFSSKHVNFQTLFLQIFFSVRHPLWGLQSHLRSVACRWPGSLTARSSAHNPLLSVQLRMVEFTELSFGMSVCC